MDLNNRYKKYVYTHYLIFEFENDVFKMFMISTETPDSFQVKNLTKILDNLSFICR